MKDNSVNALIYNITQVVLRTHFYYVTDKDLQNDLMQEGYLKAYELLSSGNYDPYRNLRTFIYTGVRNAMTNYMYHTNKESHTDIDTVDSGSWQQYKNIYNDSYFEDKLFYYDTVPADNRTLTTSQITKICNKYKCFGDYQENAEEYFNKLGIYDKTSNKVKNEEEDELVFNAIRGEIIWNLFLKS